MVILYRLPEDTAEGEMARGLLKALDVSFKEVGTEDLQTLVGDLAEMELDEEAPHNPAPIPPESASPAQRDEVKTATAVFFANEPMEVVQQFLAAYAKSGVTRIRLKSILTPHNIYWTLEELLLELHEEDRFMQAFTNLDHAMRTAKNYLEDENYTAESREKLKEPLAQATDLMKRVQNQEQISVADVQKAFEALYIATQNLIPQL